MYQIIVVFGSFYTRFIMGDMVRYNTIFHKTRCEVEGNPGAKGEKKSGTKTSIPLATKVARGNVGFLFFLSPWGSSLGLIVFLEKRVVTHRDVTL